MLRGFSGESHLRLRLDVAGWKSNVYWPNIHSINLTLFNISRDDNNFQLTCIAENVVGMTNSSIQLNVQYSMRSPQGVPPVILRLAEPEQRHDTCIEFTVRGYPHPKLRWFYKQKEILQNEYIRTEMDFYQDYLEGCLTFQNPTHINNGNYTLEASNPLGTVAKTVYGHFLMAPGAEEDIVELAMDYKAAWLAMGTEGRRRAASGRPRTVPHIRTHPHTVRQSYQLVYEAPDWLNVSIAVGLAGFACVLLLVLFVLINKYGRRSKFGMKDSWIDTNEDMRAHPNEAFALHMYAKHMQPVCNVERSRKGTRN
ncbi:NT-3 growth factor receptor [Liparis tanakae]|uniref:NT-3 growth factor receptor n=1 Tax=Liparis tanakae TaxID=230148 RepID=A0A4Z2HWA9_9TELE|nr:NT-3 growth factor receptor [Liparis tanakae]